MCWHEPTAPGGIRLGGGSDRSSGFAGMIDPYGACVSVAPAVKATLRTDVGIRPYGVHSLPMTD